MSLAASFTPHEPAIPPLFPHQRETISFHRAKPCVLNFSSAGVGKTRSWLEHFREQRGAGGGAALVLGPASILESAWVRDAERFVPELRLSVASAKNRREALRANADIYLINHDAVRALAMDPDLIPKGVDAFCIDESTAFKNPSSQRTLAALKVLAPIEHRCLMSGTPTPNGILDLFTQALLCDRGERLGCSFWKFRDTVCRPEPAVPGARPKRWVPRPQAAEAVAEVLRDITLQYRLEDVLDLPPVVEQCVGFSLHPAHRRAYERLRRDCLLELEGGRVVGAVQAVALRTKLLQLLSGAAYTTDGLSAEFSTARYRLVLDLVEARPASLVAFQWGHQRDALVREAKARGLAYGVIDGATPIHERAALVDRFQAGDLRALFAHPATAGHGLTLTQGVATIWASPTNSAELFEQFNRRVHRAGQTKRVEVIKVIARNTLEQRAYGQLDAKVCDTQALLDLLNS